MMRHLVIWLLLILMPVMMIGKTYHHHHHPEQLFRSPLANGTLKATGNQIHVDAAGIMIKEAAANGTRRWELLEAVANQVHIEDRIIVRLKDGYRYYHWDRYTRVSRSERPAVVNGMSERLKEIAYWESRLDMIGLILFGPEKSRSALRARDLPQHVDEWDYDGCLKSVNGLLAKLCAPMSFLSSRNLRFTSTVCKLAKKEAIEDAIISVCGLDNIPKQSLPQQQVPYDIASLGTDLPFMEPFDSKNMFNLEANGNVVARLATLAMSVVSRTTRYFYHPWAMVALAVSCFSLGYVISSMIRPPWEKYAEGWTEDLVADWASSPKFDDWLIKNKHRIMILPEDSDEEPEYVLDN